MSRTRTITLTIGSLAAGAVLATGVTGLALAADSSPSPNDSTSTTAPDAAGGQDPRGPFGLPGDGMRGGPGHGDGMRVGPGHDDGMRGGPGGEALHGEAVVKATDGTISTVRMIQGSVTTVSGESISITAEDGYTATFAINASTEIHTGVPARPADGAEPAAPVAGSITDVTVGDVAHVDGTVEGSNTTALEIHSMTAAQAAQLEKDRAAMGSEQLAG